MSSILKALRKIEEDKRTSQHAAPDLRTDQGRVVQKTGPWFPLVSGTIVGAVCVGLFFFWSSSSDIPVNSSRPEESVEAKISDGPTPTVADESQGPTHSIDTLSTTLPQRASAEEQIPVVVMAAEPTAVINRAPLVTDRPVAVAKPAKVVEPAKVENASAVVPVPLPEKDSQAELTPVSFEASTGSPEPLSVLPDGINLTVSDIFYEIESANRMAVVNDLPVMVGTAIDSAEVLEIQAEAVLFKIDDISYLIKISPL